MLRPMYMWNRCGSAFLLLPLLFAGCGSGADVAAEGTRDEVPAATVARFDAEAAGHAAIAQERGCVTETSGQRLSVAQARQDDTGAPVDGWLLEVPRDTRIYVCRYEGTFEGRPNTAVDVWEAADASVGGPRPGLDFRAR